MIYSHLVLKDVTLTMTTFSNSSLMTSKSTKYSANLQKLEGMVNIEIETTMFYFSFRYH